MGKLNKKQESPKSSKTKGIVKEDKPIPEVSTSSLSAAFEEIRLMRSRAVQPIDQIVQIRPEPTREEFTLQNEADTYKVFANLKHSKFLHKFPAMRNNESALINKIRNQWHGLSRASKFDLYITYGNEKYFEKYDELFEDSQEQKNSQPPKPVQNGVRVFTDIDELDMKKICQQIRKAIKQTFSSYPSRNQSVSSQKEAQSIINKFIDRKLSGQHVKPQTFTEMNSLIWTNMRANLVSQMLNTKFSCFQFTMVRRPMISTRPFTQEIYRKDAGILSQSEEQEEKEKPKMVELDISDSEQIGVPIRKKKFDHQVSFEFFTQLMEIVGFGEKPDLQILRKNHSNAMIGCFGLLITEQFYDGPTLQKSRNSVQFVEKYRCKHCTFTSTYNLVERHIREKHALKYWAFKIINNFDKPSYVFTEPSDCMNPFNMNEVIDVVKDHSTYSKQKQFWQFPHQSSKPYDIVAWHISKGFIRQLIVIHKGPQLQPQPSNVQAYVPVDEVELENDKLIQKKSKKNRTKPFIMTRLTETTSIEFITADGCKSMIYRPTGTQVTWSESPNLYLPSIFTCGSHLRQMIGRWMQAEKEQPTRPNRLRMKSAFISSCVWYALGKGYRNSSGQLIPAVQSCNPLPWAPYFGRKIAKLTLGGTDIEYQEMQPEVVQHIEAGDLMQLFFVLGKVCLFNSDFMSRYLLEIYPQQVLMTPNTREIKDEVESDRETEHKMKE